MKVSDVKKGGPDQAELGTNPVRMKASRFAIWNLSWHGWVSLALCFATIEIAIRSIENAHWITPQPSLTFILGMAMLSAFLLSRKGIKSWIAQSIALVVGVAIVGWQSAGLLQSVDGSNNLQELARELQIWWTLALEGKPAEGTIQFAVFLSAYCWLVGYLSCWAILKHGNFWVAVVFSGVTLLVNLGNLSEQHFLPFFLYLVTAILLIGQTTLARHYRNYRQNSKPYPRRLVISLALSVLVIAAIVAPVAWFAPAVRSLDGGIALAEVLPFRDDIDGIFMNFLSRVRSQKPDLLAANQFAVYFGSPLDLSDTVHFEIETKQPFYWRTRVYDIYSSGGWFSSRAVEPGVAASGVMYEPEKLLKRVQTSYTVNTRIKTDLLLSAGQFEATDIPVSRLTLAPLSFDINLVSAYVDYALPADVADLAVSLRTQRASAAGVFGLKEIQQKLPGDLILKSIGPTRLEPTTDNFNQVGGRRRLTTLELTRRTSATADTVGIQASKVLIPGQRYSVTSDITAATPQELNRAGEIYPHQVMDYYLRLPSDLPARIKQLSKGVTEGARTAYEKVVAIKQYLGRFTYDPNPQSSPNGVDAVEYFLFENQRGYCYYFASAATVMLRASGVPARLVTGYLPGRWEPSESRTTVVARDYHAWVDVYFPGYGWVEFDPTPPIGDEPVIYPNSMVTIGELPPEELLPESGIELDGSDPSALAVPEPTGLAGLAIAGIVFVMVNGLYLWLRRYWSYGGVKGIYARMRLLSLLGRTGPRPQDTPREFGNSLAARFPAQSESISLICSAYAEEIYSPNHQAVSLVDGDLEKAWHSVRGQLLLKLVSFRE